MHFLNSPPHRNRNNADVKNLQYIYFFLKQLLLHNAAVDSLFDDKGFRLLIPKNFSISNLVQPAKLVSVFQNVL